MRIYLGDLDTNAGKESQELLNSTLPWSEEFYDKSYDEIMEYHIQNNTNRIIYIEYSYSQIGLTEKWLQSISAEIGDPLTVRREILLQRLHGSSLSPYPKEDLEYIASTQRTPISVLYILKFYKFDVYTELDKAIPYIVGVDCSTGTLSDNNAITIINPYTEEPVAEFECPYVGETAYENIIIDLVVNHLPRAIVCIERNSVGDGIIDHLLHSKIANRIYYDKNKDLLSLKMHDNEDPAVSMLKKQAAEKTFYGVYTTGTSRDQMFAILARRVSEYKDKFITKNVIRDLNALVRKSSGKIEAVDGSHDDSIMSYLIGFYVLYHGNNLDLFGFYRGSDEEIGPKNQGMTHYEASTVLPESIKDVMRQSEEEAKLMDYEDTLREAMARAQRESKEMRDRSLATVEYLDNTMPGNSFDDEYADEDMDLSLFNDLNGL